MFGWSLEERVQRLREAKQVLREDIAKSEEGARAVIEQAHRDIARCTQVAASLNHI